MKLQSQKSKQIYSVEEIELYSKSINGTISFHEHDGDGLRMVSLRYRQYDGCHQKEDREELYVVIED